MNGLLSIGVMLAAAAASNGEQDAPAVPLNKPVTLCSAKQDAGQTSARKGKADLTDLSGPRTASTDKVDVRDMSPPRTAPTASASATASTTPCPPLKR